MKGIGILPGFRPHYIDHLVPLCHLMGIPLLVTDRMVKELVSNFYPPLELIFADAEDYSLDPYLEPYDTFFYVDFSRLASGSFQFHEYFSRKKGRSLITLHGNPDKFHEAYWLEKLADEDIVLVYGPQLASLLERKGIKKKPILCGNYRLEFYKEYEDFFDSKIPFKKKKTTVLYAPTWSAKEAGSELGSYYSYCLHHYREVFEGLKNRYQLLVKLHPLMIKTYPEEVETMVMEYPEVQFLNDSPLIYPLLKQVDLYLGDYSSIGYDFLYFDRPLFFLQPTHATPLQSWGQIVQKEEIAHLGDKILTRNRKSGYSETFGKRKKLTELKEEIENVLV